MSNIITPGRKGYEPIVKVGIPYYGSIPHSAYVIAQELAANGIPGYRTYLVPHPTSLLQFGRCNIVEEPEGIPWDFLFFLDTDMGFGLQEMAPTDQGDLLKPIVQMKQILDHGLDICGGVYCGHQPPHLPHLYRRPRREDGSLATEGYLAVVDYPENEVIEVDAIGTGFLCIKNRVFHAFSRELQRRMQINRQFQEWKEAQEGGSLADIPGIPDIVRKYIDISKPDLHKPFWLDFIYDDIKKKWSMMGEDMFFCREAQNLGFKIHADTGVEVGHLTEWYLSPDQYKKHYRPEAIESRRQYKIDRKLTIEDGADV